MLQTHVAEQVLHGEGLSRQDIHGVDRETVTVRKRYDIAASLRRACAACGRVRLRRALSVAAVGFGVVAAYTASHAFAIVFAALAVAAVGVHRAPDVVFERPDPAFERSNTQSDGMTDREVGLRLAIVNERAEYKQELIDKQQKEAERKADRDRNRVRF